MFDDRMDAGRQLAARLGHLRGGPVVVLGLPRGGVPVAAEVADALGAPLDVIVIRKLGVPFQPELGMGAVGEDGVRVINYGVVRAARITAAELAAVETRERAEVARRVERYRAGRPRSPLHGNIAVVVDDGIATGSTARAACQVSRALGATRVVLATPVAPRGWQDRIGRDADEMVAVMTPVQFYGIGQFYADFSQTTDDQVAACLEQAAVAEPDHDAQSAGMPAPRTAADAPPSNGSPAAHNHPADANKTSLAAMGVPTTAVEVTFQTVLPVIRSRNRAARLGQVLRMCLPSGWAWPRKYRQACNNAT
jgi:putative phosphoribosyl transferase